MTSDMLNAVRSGHLRRTIASFLVFAATAFWFSYTMADEHYSFGKATFSDSMWIKDGALFENVTSVEVEMIDNGAFKFQVVDPKGNVISERVDKTGAGWHVFDFASGMGPRPGRGPYKLRFVNVGPGTRQIHGGNVIQR